MTTQTNPTQALDVLQQFDALLKNHSIVVSDRENLAKLFQNIVDLCTQMPKTKLKAAIKAATQEPKTAKPRAKAQPKPKTQPKETMVGPEGAADAPMISDIVAAPVARGRGRPRKADTVAAPVATAAAIADANPNAETAEKKRRGRPKKDKSVTISSNDDEDALIAKMMADVASMQKDEAVIAYPAETVAATVIADVADVVIADPITDDDETEDEASPCSPIQTFTGPLMRCEETTPVAESMSPVVPTSSPSSFQTFDFEVEVPAPKAPAPKALKAAKEPKVKAAKEPKVPKAPKEPKAKVTKAPKEAKAPKAAVAKKDTKVVAVAAPVAKPLASFATTPIHSDSRPENQETNGGIYLMAMVPTTSFSYNGKSYLRTETDNVYDNLTFELIGVWDHSNHEVIAAFDDEDDELYFSDEE